MAPRKQPSTTAAARKATAPTKGTNGGTRRPAAKPANGTAPTGDTFDSGRTNKTGETCLRRGGLEALVLRHLKAHPKGDFSPSELANVLTRSGGAIANALERLVAKGEATRVSDKPRRYRSGGAKPAGKARAPRR